MNTDFQTTLVSGSGPYHNPLDIYNPGHKIYTPYKYGEKNRPDISGIIQNINTLKPGSELKLLQPDDMVRVFNPALTEDFVIPNDMSGLTVNLRFGSYNIITETNEFKNF